jgi:putative acetyltransferase
MGPACPATLTTGMQIETDDPARADVLALLEEHLRDMYAQSPPESVHALDVSRLKEPDITFWTVRDGAHLLGCGALKELDPRHGEIKSMRTPASQRRRGAGRAMLAHIILTARARGYTRLSLETGPAGPFTAALRLYESAGFTVCGPFADYRLDPFSVFMTLELQPPASGLTPP